MLQNKILLIDEVDVFFSEEFFNKAYVPLAEIKHHSISKLIDFIWTNKNKKINFYQIQESEEYKECLDLFKP